MKCSLRAVVSCLAAFALVGQEAPGFAEPTQLVTAPAAQAPAPSASHGDPPSSAQRAPAAMSAAPGEPASSDERVRMPPMRITPDPRGNDRRTAYVGAGVVVLAAMFWWNRRRRDRFEREDRGAPARRAVRDDDADDLHAAARSDRPERPDRRDP